MSDTTIIANFEEGDPEYTITLEIDDTECDGEATGGGVYLYDETTTLLAVADDGCKFLH